MTRSAVDWPGPIRRDMGGETAAWLAPRSAFEGSDLPIKIPSARLAMTATTSTITCQARIVEPAPTATVPSGSLIVSPFHSANA